MLKRSVDGLNLKNLTSKHLGIYDDIPLGRVNPKIAVNAMAYHYIAILWCSTIFDTEP